MLGGIIASIAVAAQPSLLIHKSPQCNIAHNVYNVLAFYMENAFNICMLSFKD